MATFTKEEVLKHCTKEDAWIVIDGKVYDVTPFIEDHPGGEAILRNVGKDSSEGFHGQSSHDPPNNFIADKLKEMYKGDLA